jgi:protein kinase X
LLTTVGTGTFGRVLVVRDKSTKAYYALKIMSIAEVLRLKQTEHVKNEKEILSQVKHPFIINLYWTCHTDKFLYMLLEYVCGGELFSYLRNAVKFSNETAVFFAAEIVSALEYLHSLSIIYRDLKPENLLLDRLGHVRLCDFGFAKKVYDR